MIYYKTSEEIELIRESCLLVCKTLAQVASHLKPGITGSMIDQMAESFIRDHGAVPGFKGYGGFPATLCISKNEEVVHGIPSVKEFVDGDIVSLDCGVFMNNFFGDAAYTFAIGEVDEETMHLLVTTKNSLSLAIEVLKPGRRIGDLSHTIQHYCEKENNYSVVRELVGHGIGRNLHEAPEVPNYGSRGRGIKFQEGLVLAIEPMINMGKKDVRQASDGWTIYTKDKKPSAHYEHTVAVTQDEPDILSDHSIIEKAIKNNGNLKEISLKK